MRAFLIIALIGGMGWYIWSNWDILYMNMTNPEEGRLHTAANKIESLVDSKDFRKQFLDAFIQIEPEAFGIKCTQHKIKATDIAHRLVTTINWSINAKAPAEIEALTISIGGNYRFPEEVTYTDKKPTKINTIGIVGDNSAHSIIIAGFTDDLEEPVVTKHIDIEEFIDEANEAYTGEVSPDL